jgi:ABC-type glycerol-3-phosphate transport system substrate-binding protein
MSRKRTIVAALLTGVVAISTAACGGSSGSASATAAATAATSGNITWWGWTPELSTANSYIAEFNKQYPNIHVTYKQLTIDGYDAAIRPALASSAGPDVFDVAPGSANGSVDVYNPSTIDLTPAVEKALGSDWKSKLSPIGVNGMTVKNKLVGLSVGAVYDGTVWINKDLFDKYNVKPPTNLDEWKQACATFKANNVGCFTQGVNQVAFDMDTFEAIADDVQPGLYLKATQGQAKWTDPQLVKALSLWGQLFTDGILEPGSKGMQQYPDANNQFMSQKYAMDMMGTWYMQYTEPAGQKAAISAAAVANPQTFTQVPMLFPDIAGTGNKGSLFGDADFGLAVSQRSKNQGAATTFAVWLGTSEKGQQTVANILNDIPALASAKPDWSTIELVNKSVQQPALQAILDQAATTPNTRFATVNADLNTALGDALTQVAAGTTPDKAAATLQTAANAAAGN